MFARDKDAEPMLPKICSAKFSGKWRLVISGLISLLVAGCLGAGPFGNASVPQPTKRVDPGSYIGLWYELARYDNGFERGCEGVTAEYTAKTGGEIGVVNTCRQGSLKGPVRKIEGNAKIVEGSGNAKFKVSFVGPFYFGNYWIIDHAQDYSWSIVGEPSGGYLWLLSRSRSKAALAIMTRRAKSLGYDTSLLRITAQ